MFFQGSMFGLFGPTNKISLQHIQAIADFKEIPQIITEAIEIQNRNWSAINLYPYHVAYSKVIFFIKYSKIFFKLSFFLA